MCFKSLFPSIYHFIFGPKLYLRSPRSKQIMFSNPQHQHVWTNIAQHDFALRYFSDHRQKIVLLFEERNCVCTRCENSSFNLVDVQKIRKYFEHLLTLVSWISHVISRLNRPFLCAIQARTWSSNHKVFFSQWHLEMTYLV